MTFPNARDCEHGHQRGKCVHCDLAECETYRDTILGQRQDMAVEISRMRRRIECLRGGLKSASGRFLDVGDLESADDCLRWAGDMEPPLMGSNVEVTGAARLFRAASLLTAGLGQ